MNAIGQRLGAEFLGSLMLAGTVIGSGIMAERLASGNDAIALLANAVATSAILFVLITALAPISGAHFNPAVSFVMALRREISAWECIAYIAVQICGCVAGAVLAHTMFELPPLQEATQARGGLGQAVSEAVATFALVLAILLVSRSRPAALPAVVSLVIGAGYWWTASTSFANPAITIARAMTDTFTGIRPADAPIFILAQFVAAVTALVIARALTVQPAGRLSPRS